MNITIKLFQYIYFQKDENNARDDRRNEQYTKTLIQFLRFVDSFFYGHSKHKNTKLSILIYDVNL